MRETGEYLNLLQAVRPRPTRKNYWDSRNRFMFAMVADSLEDPRRRVEEREDDLAGDPRLLYGENVPSDCDQISNFGLIRSGCNERLEIDDYRPDLLFQAFDADGMAAAYG